jgi:hypothetical protein
MLEGKTGRCYIGSDRVQTRVALKGVLADLTETEFARLADTDRCIQIVAPACHIVFQVGTHQIIPAAAGVEVRTAFVYLSPLLERASLGEAQSCVAQALTVALEWLAGRSDIALLQIAGVAGARSPAGGAARPSGTLLKAPR